MTKNEEFYKENLRDFQYALDVAKLHISHVVQELKLSDIEIESRIKTLPSVLEKCERKSVSCSRLNDIAGIRIICPFKDNVYKIFDAIIAMPMIIVKERKDYIAAPKKNGYQSLHLIVEVPIFSNINGSKVVPVEIQLRTHAMDLWGTIEHIVKYKNPNPSPVASDMLKAVAEQLNDFEERIIELRDFDDSKNDSKS